MTLIIACLFIYLTITIENCKIKKLGAKVNILILINYSTTNYPNGKSTTIFG
jgi:hypothetical protein